MQEPTETQKDYCDTQANKLRACDRSLDEMTLARDCQDSVLELSQEYADKTADCIDGRCEDIEYCLDQLAQQYGTDLRVFDATLNVSN
jgi:hypothetical protein